MQPAPEIGHLIPLFNVQDSRGKVISPDLLLGHPYVLYFYPKNETPGCLQEACDLRDIHIELQQLHACVIGVSPDSNASHNQFIGKYHLNFPLISDPYYELCSLFGVWEEKKVFGQTKWGVTRTTFIVDAKGIIRWIEKPVQIAGHTQRILEALKNLPKPSEPL
jgi:peroxiredoxin Q/BCP